MSSSGEDLRVDHGVSWIIILLGLPRMGKIIVVEGLDLVLVDHFGWLLVAEDELVISVDDGIRDLGGSHLLEEVLEVLWSLRHPVDIAGEFRRHVGLLVPVLEESFAVGDPPKDKEG